MSEKNTEVGELVHETNDQIQTNSSVSPELLISKAIDKNLPVETLEKLMAMRDKLKAEQAKEAYLVALSEFQYLCPVIKKDKAGAKTQSGAVAYKFAPLESIVTQIKDPLKKTGLSYTWLTQLSDKDALITCIISHKLGHSKSTDMKAPLSSRTGVMNATQQAAATVTYLKRYTLCNALGIVTEDEDNDGADIQDDRSKNGSKPNVKKNTPAKEEKPSGKKITAKQVVFLKKLLTDKGKTESDILKHYKKMDKLEGLSLEHGKSWIDKLLKLPTPKKEDSKKKVKNEDEETEKEDMNRLITCYFEECNREFKRKDAYKDWFCCQDHQEKWAEDHYPKNKKFK